MALAAALAAARALAKEEEEEEEEEGVWRLSEPPPFGHSSRSPSSSSSWPSQDADTDAAETSQLVELVQSGAVYESMKATISSFKLRCAGLTPPSHAVTVLEASLASAQKTRNANAALTAAISKEVSELRDAQGPPVRGDSKRRQ